MNLLRLGLTLIILVFITKMGRHNIDPKLGTINITTIVKKMYKHVRPLTPRNKEQVFGLLAEQTHMFFMASMAVYSRTIDRQTFTKCGQGAGCLVRDYARDLHLLQVYNLTSSKLACEEVVCMDDIIFVDVYDLMLLIVQSDVSR